VTVQQRLKVIEERLAALEQAPTPSSERKTLPRKEKLWALNYLEKHAPESGQVVYAGTVNVETIGHYIWQVSLPTENILQQPWNDVAPVLAALAHPVRLELLKMILQGKRTSQELQALAGLGTTGQLYHHLKELQAAGWLKAESRGTYRVVAEQVIPLLAIVLAALGDKPKK
jgi:DNA-binding transcriptional ArsR family regulator